jgi:hypothetical protein
MIRKQSQEKPGATTHWSFLIQLLLNKLHWEGCLWIVLTSVLGNIFDDPAYAKKSIGMLLLGREIHSL